MKLLEGVVEDVTVLEPHGRLDSAAAKEFGDRLTALVQAGRSAILVDLKSIAYISSAGFHVLLDANRAMAKRARQACALRRDRRGKTAVRDRRLSRDVCDLPDAGRRDRHAEVMTAVGGELIALQP